MGFDSARRRRRGIGLTALIDVVFILLVFFMLTSRFLDERAMDLRTSGGGGAMDTTLPLLRVLAYGLELDGEPLSAAALEARLGGRPTRVLPAAGVDLQRLVTVLEILNEFGVGPVALVEGP